MKKITTLVLATILSAITTFANAEWSAGITGTGVSMDASAKEDGKTKADVTRDETLEAMFGSIFLEYNFGPASVGLDVMPYTFETEKVTNVRTDNNIDTASNDQGTTTAHLEVDYNTMLYVLAPLGDAGVYAKVGASFADVTSVESTATSTSYPDDELIGGHISLGYQANMQDGIFVRAEVGYSEYDDLSGTSSSQRTKVQINNLSGEHARISIGKAF